LKLNKARKKSFSAVHKEQIFYHKAISILNRRCLCSRNTPRRSRTSGHSFRLNPQTCKCKIWNR